MHHSVKRIAKLALATFVAAAMPIASAAAWQPTTNVEYIVPAGPGGAVDTYGRIMAKIFDEQDLLGQPMLILNKPGGAGMIAANELIKKPGDGNIFAMFSTGYIISNLLGEFRHDLQKDFTMGPILFEETLAVAVKADSPLKTANDLVEALKKDSASLRIGVAPSGRGHIYLGLAQPLASAGVDVPALTVAPFRSSAETLVALQGGHIEVASASVTNMVAALQSGAIRLLAVTGEQRLGGLLENVPTWKEQGVDSSFSSVQGVMFPRDMSAEQMAFWDKTFRTLSESQEWRDALDRYQVTPRFMDHKEADAYLKEQIGEIDGLLKSVGIERSTN